MHFVRYTYGKFSFLSYSAVFKYMIRMVKIKKVHNTAEIRLASTLKHSFSDTVEVINFTVSHNKDGMFSNLSYPTEPFAIILLLQILPVSVRHLICSLRIFL